MEALRIGGTVRINDGEIIEVLAGPFIDTMHYTCEGYELIRDQAEKVSQKSEIWQVAGATLSIKTDRTIIQLGGELLAGLTPHGALQAVMRHMRPYLHRAQVEPYVTRADVAVDYLVDDTRSEADRRAMLVGRAELRAYTSSTSRARTRRGEPYGRGQTVMLGKRTTGTFQLRDYNKTAMKHYGPMRRWKSYPKKNFRVDRLEVEIGRKALREMRRRGPVDEARILAAARMKVSSWGPSYPGWDGDVEKVKSERSVLPAGIRREALEDLSRAIGRLEAVEPTHPALEVKREDWFVHKPYEKSLKVTKRKLARETRATVSWPGNGSSESNPNSTTPTQVK